MGTIVYKNLIEFLLEEGDKTKEEIIKEAANRFEFDKEALDFNIGLGLTMGERSGFYSKDEKGMYHLLKHNEGILSRRKFLESLNKATPQYLEQRPWIVKLKTALEEDELRR
ncbi:MAG: hypothetical protein KKF68_03280 [Nanoarchaeota archaeon]|nr:hypothetical protein [Nanoarchaeota archaeon]